MEKNKRPDNRWVINRAGLVNFWYYDEEIFEFSNGRLLLRGSNGSGKIGNHAELYSIAAGWQ